MNVQDIIHLRKYLSILEHKDGKLSIKLSLKALTDPAILEMAENNKNKPMPSAILNTSVQKLARIVNIEYDTKLIEPKELETILTTRNREEFNQLTEKYLKVLSV